MPSPTNVARFRGAAAFTLVELLVTLAIIGVMIALLIPAVSRAKDVAKTIHCQSSQRQIGISFGTYLTDFNGVYPYGNPSRANTWPRSWSAAYCFPWQMAIRPYLGNYRTGQVVRILLCEANPWPPYVLNAQSDPATSYGMNSSTFPPNWCDQSGVDPATDPSHYLRSMRDERVKVPSDVMLLAEVPNSAASSNVWGWTMAANTTEYVPFTSNPYQQPQPTGYWLNDSIAIRVSGGNPCARVSHDLAWNSLMADGHVQLVSKKWLYTNTAGKLGKMYWFNQTN